MRWRYPPCESRVTRIKSSFRIVHGDLSTAILVNHSLQCAHRPLHNIDTSIHDALPCWLTANILATQTQ